MSKSRFDKVLDSRIRCAGKQLLRKLASEAPSKEELASFSGPKQKLDRLIKASIKDAVKRHYFKHFIGVAARVSAFILVLVIAAVIALASSKDLRAKLYYFLFPSGEKAVAVSISDIAADTDYILPGYLPEGYVFIESCKSASETISVYTNADENSIVITKKDNTSTNTDLHKTKATMQKNVMTDEDGKVTVSLFCGNYYYTVSGVIDKSELIKIAQSLPE